jgi:hypothetical protein
MPRRRLKPIRQTEADEGGAGGLAAEGAPDFFHLSEEFLVRDAIGVGDLEAGLGEGVVPVAEAMGDEGDGEAAGVEAIAAGGEAGAGRVERGDAAEVGENLGVCGMAAVGG